MLITTSKRLILLLHCLLKLCKDQSPPLAHPHKTFGSKVVPIDYPKKGQTQNFGVFGYWWDQTQKKERKTQHILKKEKREKEIRSKDVVKMSVAHNSSHGLFSVTSISSNPCAERLGSLMFYVAKNFVMFLAMVIICNGSHYLLKPYSMPRIVTDIFVITSTFHLSF